MNRIFSPGKLMLTSEYFAIDGALVLAVPTQLGQELFYEEIPDGKSVVVWEALHQNNPWLFIKINYSEWKILETNLPESADFVMKVLRNVQDLSKIRFQNNASYHLKTNLQFPPDFGLGSSSTLMTNLSEWAKIDAFLLNEKSLGGSGYDIAVAKEKSAVLYKNENGRKEVEKVKFSPNFKDELIFIHLNQKQDSREGIRLYRSKTKSPELIREFSDLTKQIFEYGDLEKFSQLMTLHEQKVSDFLQIETVKEKYFKNCPVFVKSLGAWGGDFVLSSKFPGYLEWFSGKGFSTVFQWSDLVN